MNSDWKSAVTAADRLDAVKRSGLVGFGGDDSFDRLIELAIEVTGAPRGCITLVDDVDTSAISAWGFPEGPVLRAPNEFSFCRFVVGSSRPFLVENANLDDRTVGEPAIEAFGAMAWIGYPITDPNGVVLGTLCLMDHEPREWTPSDIQVVATLAQAVSTEIALRCARTEVETARTALADFSSGR